MTVTRCARCGKDPAEGFAMIGDDRYCHESERPSCYELAQWGDSEPMSKYLGGLRPGVQDAR